MNDNKNQNRGKKGGGGQGNQRRRRSGGGGRPGGGGYQQSAPRGPVMTSLGESTYEAVFDHGNEGYGVWFDGMVRDDPMYRQHWKGGRPIFVKIEEDKIVITRTLDKGDEGDDSSEDVSMGDAEANGNNGSTEPEAKGDSDSEPEAKADGDADADAPAAPKRRTTRRRVVVEDDDQPAASSDDE